MGPANQCGGTAFRRCARRPLLHPPPQPSPSVPHDRLMSQRRRLGVALWSLKLVVFSAGHAAATRPVIQILKLIEASAGLSVLGIVSRGVGSRFGENDSQEGASWSRRSIYDGAALSDSESVLSMARKSRLYACMHGNFKGQQYWQSSNLRTTL